MQHLLFETKISHWLCQSPSYMCNFTGTKTTKEMCAGVVKAAKVFPKKTTCTALWWSSNALRTTKICHHFLHRHWIPKQIECIHVDRATDEGPSHEEVKYWWTVRHLVYKRLVTLVSCHSSGSSYLNRVELLNGSLALGHTNLFIPSTLGGSPYNPDTGLLDMES